MLNALISRHQKSAIDTSDLQEELIDILSSAAELSNARASTIITLRSEQHAALPLPEFLDLFNDSWNFVLKCEVICRRMIVGLRGIIVSQVCSLIKVVLVTIAD
jgi:vacuolar protein sorting-associated protein 54